MDFFCRQLEAAWIAARQSLAQFIGASENNVAFVDNATYGMNVVADSFPLAAGDEVLLTDHEYGAVRRIWQRACRRARAEEPKIVELPWPVESSDQIVDAMSRALTDRTRLMVVSHVTSATACVLPAKRLCCLARERGIAICIDGPHALVQVPLALDALGCDFYTASCHKWLSAPFGSGFLYVAPWQQERIQPPLLSWGRLPPKKCAHWSDEFHWLGTRDPTPLLAVPAAIAFLEGIGLDVFRRHTHALASYARERLVNLTGRIPATPDSPEWYVSMVNVPLPDGDAAAISRCAVASIQHRGPHHCLEEPSVHPRVLPSLQSKGRHRPLARCPEIRAGVTSAPEADRIGCPLRVNWRSPEGTSLTKSGASQRKRIDR